MTAAPVTLCFLLRTHAGQQQVLLGLKKTGFGKGKIVGIGGHVEPGESVVAAICREVEEETGIVLAAMELIPAGTVEFVFPARGDWDMFTTVFLCRRFLGDPVESPEIAPRWYPVDALPHAHMWADASHWLPAFLSGERGHWRVVLNGDNETVASSTHTPPAGTDGAQRRGS
ncbi:8-oxo-dGTP diphosphatase [Arthrobacter sp. HLT1-20]